MNIAAAVEGCLRISVLIAFYEERSDHRRYDACSGKEERIDCSRPVIGKNSQRDRRYDSADVRFEKVRAHAGNVTNVVTDIISNNCRVSRVILRDIVLNLADKVSADVRSLGINAAADTCEKRDGRCSEAVAEEDIRIAGNQINDTYTEKSESYDRKSHDRAAVVGDSQGSGHAGGPGCICSSDVSLRRDSHAEKSCHGREYRADQETNRSDPVSDAHSDDDKQHCRKYDKNLIFREEERVGSLTDRAGYFFHPVGPLLLLAHRACKV